MSFKIDIKGTIIATLSLIIGLVAINFVPVLAIIILPFLTIPGVILWYRSKPSFYITTVVSALATVLMKNSILLTVFFLITLMSIVISQLLVERTSKERILYITTSFMSIFTILAILIMQVTGVLPLMSKVIANYKNTTKNLLESGGSLTPDLEKAFDVSMTALQASIPGYIVFIIFLFVLLNLVVTFPILRKNKIATPLFKPLLMWNIKRSVATIYVITILISLFVTPEQYMAYSIVINLQYVLEWIIFIQALSLIHFFIKAKKLPVSLGVLLFILAFVFKPIANLFGLLDIWFNLKKRIK